MELRSGRAARAVDCGACGDSFSIDRMKKQLCCGKWTCATCDEKRSTMYVPKCFSCGSTNGVMFVCDPVVTTIEAQTALGALESTVFPWVSAHLDGETLACEIDDQYLKDIRRATRIKDGERMQRRDVKALIQFYERSKDFFAPLRERARRTLFCTHKI